MGKLGTISWWWLWIWFKLPPAYAITWKGWPKHIRCYETKDLQVYRSSYSRWIDEDSKIGDSIRDAGYFTLEADEVTDSSNKEQLIICLRWVDNHFDSHEEFICLHDVDDTTADTIVYYLKDTVLRMNLSLSKCRAQCYDWASNMKKVAKEIQSIEPWALCLHCYGHSLNLAVSDTLKKIKCLSDALDHSLEICKLLKYSPRRDAIFHKLHQELSPQVPGYVISVRHVGLYVTYL